jgi:hypothetical protein
LSGVVWHLSGVVWHLSGVVWHLSGVVGHLSGVVWHLSGVVGHLSGVVWHLSGVVGLFCQVFLVWLGPLCKMVGSVSESILITKRLSVAPQELVQHESISHHSLVHARKHAVEG